MAELVPRVWGLCELSARANINLTIDAEEVDRLELSLDVFEALAALVAQSTIRSGRASAWPCRPTRRARWT
jgi:proline dehydrogenase